MIRTRLTQRRHMVWWAALLTSAIFLAQTSPSGAAFTGSIVINGGASITNTANVTLNLEADSGNILNPVTQMRLANAGNYYTDWMDYLTEKNWVLPSSEGGCLVWVQYKTFWGTTSSEYSDDIILDRYPPSGSVVINSGNPSYTKSTAVTLQLSAGDPNPPIKMRLANSYGSWTGWENYATSRAWTLPAVEGLRTVWVQFTDAAGNISGGISDDITLDVTPPRDGQIMAVRITGGNSVQLNWGGFLDVTHVAMGNHDSLPPGGVIPYFSYFGSAAGPAPGGYYSYNIGSNWHVIVLNTMCSLAGGCGPGSAQYNWSRDDLAANTRQCLLAVWHHPRFSSGQFGGFTSSAPWWDLLYQYKADIVVDGHNHGYERFDLINPSEQAASDGIREFVAGTGGAPGPSYTYAQHPLDPNEAIRNQSTLYGVLQLTLNSSSYNWKFLPAAGYTFTDSGTTDCH